MKRVAAGKFKDQCLQLLDQVAEDKTPITITKRGKPVATLVPYSPARQERPLAGSILHEHGDPYGTGESWDADHS